MLRDRGENPPELLSGHPFSCMGLAQGRTWFPRVVGLWSSEKPALRLRCGVSHLPKTPWTAAPEWQELGMGSEMILTPS